LIEGKAKAYSGGDTVIAPQVGSKFKLFGGSIEGEVSVNTRKQKTFLFYELNMSFKWQGKSLPSNIEGKGSVNVPYISEENDDDDFEVNVSLENENSKEQTNLKSDFRAFIVPQLKEKIPLMLRELRDVSITKTQLTQKDQPSAKVLDKIAPITIPKEHSEKKPSKSIPSFYSFTSTEKFVCAARDIYEVLLIEGKAKAYSGGDTVIAPQVGSKFKLFGGSIEGEIVELIPNQKIVQKWRFNTWPQDHYSIVTIQLEEKGGKTILKLEQTGIPDEDKERTEAGWRENYWRRIKGIFGFGPLI